MINNKYISLAVVAVLLSMLFHACYKDLGNYDYSEINEVEIFEFEFVTGDMSLNQDGDTLVTIPMGKNLVIQMNMTFTEDVALDEDNYEYEWITYRKGVVGVGEERTKVLSTAKDLNAVVELRPGEYYLYYRVRDLTTSVKWTKMIHILVTNPLGEGWMVLCDDNGASRLDMVNVLNSGAFNVYKDVLAITDSNIPEYYMNAKAIGVRCFNYYAFGEKSLYLLTEGGTTQINPIDFTWQEYYDFSYEAMGQFPDGFYTDDLMEDDPYVGSFCGYMRSGTNYYQYVRSTNISYDYPINYVDGEQFEASPYIAQGGVGRLNVLYDNTNKQFVTHRLGHDNCMAIPLQDGYLFDYKTGMELIYMDKQSNEMANGEVFAILKNPADEKFYLARFLPSTGQQTGFDEIIAPGFNEAQHLAVSPEFPYIFYVVNDVLFEYDWVDQKVHQMVDYAAEGIEVTMLDFFDNGPRTYATRLMVGSYKDDEQQGRLQITEVQPRNGKLILRRNYSGLGKIVSVDYLESK